MNRPYSESLSFKNITALAFTSALLVHMILWTLLPNLLLTNASLDMIEGLAWGHEWQLGYEKDPPLFPWVIEVVTKWSHKALWTSYLTAQLCVATAFFAVWRLGRRVATEDVALVGALLLEGIYYFNFPTSEFNDIILQMPFAALFGWLLHRALTENRLVDWALSGLVAGLGLWARYSMGAYILPLAAFVVLYPEARRRLASPGPWILVLTLLLVFLPHMYWIIESDFISIKYVGRRAPVVDGIGNFLAHFLSFLGAQVLALTPMLLMLVILCRWRGVHSRLQSDLKTFDQAYLATLALGPLAVSLSLSIITVRPLRSMWGAPLWCFAGLFAVTMIRPVLTKKRLCYFGRAWLIALLLPALVFILEQIYGPRITSHEKRTHFPGAQLALTVTDRWHASINAPLKYVIGDTWYAGNVAFYSVDRPSTTFTHAYHRASLWTDTQDLKRFGAVLIWDVKQEGTGIPPKLAARFPGAIPQSTVNLAGDVSVHNIGLAFVYPEPSAGDR
jgi:4-amino-4-deoxy-L-arabinose transferase-like glycosyltransferase